MKEPADAGEQAMLSAAWLHRFAMATAYGPAMNDHITIVATTSDGVKVTITADPSIRPAAEKAACEVAQAVRPGAPNICPGATTTSD